MKAEDLERIESKIAYLERANADLGDVIYRQQREIDRLRQHFQALFERFDTIQPPESPRQPEDERPPHY